MSIDTACSSALVAVHTACRAIRNRECDMAIAGSIRINMLPVRGQLSLGIDSSDGKTRTFDDNSDGTGRGQYNYRLAVVFESREELKRKLERLASPVVFGDIEETGVYYGCHKMVSGEEIIDSGTKESDWKAKVNVEDLIRSGRKDRTTLGEIGRLYVRGSKIEWDKLYQNESTARVSLPVYPFERNRCWIKAGENLTRKREHYCRAAGSLMDKTKVVLKGREDGRYTNTEHLLAQVYGEVLGLDEISIFDNFYEMGGDSFIGMKIINGLNKTMYLKFMMNEEKYTEILLQSVRHIITAGEQLILTEPFIKQLKANNACLHNHYGPSETHVVTAYSMNPGGDIRMIPPIGKPIHNTGIYILDKNMMPQPVVIPGEIYIGGHNVGRGYYNRPELTDYMIPSYFVKLDRLPLTPNGKLDRKALPEPGGSMNTGVEYEAPAGETEEKLAAIWREVLRTDRIGVNDNFFDIGGHSLKAVVLASRIHKEFHVEVPLRELFGAPTVKGLAKYIAGAAVGKYSPIQPAGKKDYYRQSPAQKRLFILKNGETLPYHLAREFYTNVFDGDQPYLTNVYGPTECCVDTTAFPVEPGALGKLNVIPIGRPLGNCSVYIFDGDLNIVPMGVVGDIYISGDGLARGYLNRPELTAEKFISLQLNNNYKYDPQPLTIATANRQL